METSRDDVSIVIRSAFLKKGIQQRFSLLALIIFSVILIYVDTIKARPLDYLRSFIKDTIYRGSVIVSLPAKSMKNTFGAFQNLINLSNENTRLKKENAKLKDKIYDPNYLIFENQQLRQLIEEQIASPTNLVSARVLFEKGSPYLNSFIINVGSNKKIKNSMAVMDGQNFVGRIVDVNFFSSRVLLVTDLNSKIPVVIEPLGYQAILSGRGESEPVLEYLPENHEVQLGNKVYTSGKEGIFRPGIPIGEVIKNDEKILVSVFSDISQILFVNVNLENN